MSRIDLTIYNDRLKNTIQRARERDIIIPTIAQMKDPSLIPASVKEELKGIGLWELNPRNLFRITWKNEPVEKGGGFVGRKILYTPSDIRYTRSKDDKTLYAITLGWPQSSELTLNRVKVDNAKGAKVTLLGYDKPMDYKVNPAKQLVISVPDLNENQRPCKDAYVFKLSGFTGKLSFFLFAPLGLFFSFIFDFLYLLFHLLIKSLYPLFIFLCQFLKLLGGL